MPPPPRPAPPVGMAAAAAAVKAGAAGGAAAAAGGSAAADKKDKGKLREAAGTRWFDATLTEWPENDYRVGAGKLLRARPRRTGGRIERSLRLRRGVRASMLLGRSVNGQAATPRTHN